MIHPIVACASDLSGLLKAVADVNPTFMSTEDKACALKGLARVEAQVAELRLRVLADAGDVAAGTAARDAAGWLAQHTHARFDAARADLALAGALDRRYPTLAAALRAGDANVAQARVIVRAMDALPDTVHADTVSRAEAHLVARRPCSVRRSSVASGGSPGGRRARIAEAAEARRLAELEANAAQLTRFTMRRQGDGTTRISGRLPDAAATRLATYLEAYANPRKDPADGADDAAAGDPFTRLPYPRRMGEALCQFLESIDITRLPIHGGDATTLVITMSLDSLRAELATADLIGAGLVPGDELTGDTLTAAQARRLACTAKLIPAVLGGDTIPLDLGRARRLFSPGQRKALLLRDTTCRAEGCDVPGTWAEAHHLDPWSTGGRTDLDQRRSCSAAIITTAPTTPGTAPTDSPTATSGSTDANRPTGCALPGRAWKALHTGSLLLSTGRFEVLARGSSGSAVPGVASCPRVREVADPKCRCAGAGRPRWILETPRSALPDPCQRRRRRRVVRPRASWR